MFLSRQALKSLHSSTSSVILKPLDDIESLFFLMSWVAFAHTGFPLSRDSLKPFDRLPPSMKSWINPNLDVAERDKGAFISLETFNGMPKEFKILQKPLEAMQELLRLETFCGYRCLKDIQGGITDTKPCMNTGNSCILDEFSDLLRTFDDAIAEGHNGGMDSDMDYTWTELGPMYLDGSVANLSELLDISIEVEPKQSRMSHLQKKTSAHDLGELKRRKKDSGKGSPKRTKGLSKKRVKFEATDDVMN